MSRSTARAWPPRERTALALEDQGHDVTVASPAIDGEQVLREYVALTAMAVAAALEDAPPEPTAENLEAVSLTSIREARERTSTEAARAFSAFSDVCQAIGRFFTDYELLVTPTLAQLPSPHGSLRYDDAAHTMTTWLESIFEYGLFTEPFSIGGQPAISLPLAQSADGLPIGVQLVAPYGRDDLLLRVAAQLEAAHPWHERRPAICA